MKAIALSLALGLALESLFAWMAFGTGWGPCGPGTPLGFAGMAAHLLPGLPVAVAAESLGLSSREAWFAMMAAQAITWIGVVGFVLRARTRHAGGRFARADSPAGPPLDSGSVRRPGATADDPS